VDQRRVVDQVSHMSADAEPHDVSVALSEPDQKPGGVAKRAARAKDEGTARPGGYR
jgi:hypothetical protein